MSRIVLLLTADVDGSQLVGSTVDSLGSIPWQNSFGVLTVEFSEIQYVLFIQVLLNWTKT